jgi:hypothetical protein
MVRKLFNGNEGVEQQSLFEHSRVNVTPELAQKWLDTMVVNRRPVKSKIKDYGQSMREGKWFDQGEGIKFDFEGHLKDGQNRLMAIIEQNVVVPLEVLRGVHPDSQKYMDIGAARKPGDSLYMAGIEYSSKISTSLTLLNQYYSDGFVSIQGGNRRLNTFEVIEALEKYPEVVESAKYIFNTKIAQKLMTGSHLVFCHYVFRKLDPVACTTFWEKVDNGYSLTKNDPIHLLREKMISNKAASHVSKQDPVLMIAYVVKAWNLYRAGRTVSRLQYTATKNETFPKAI